MALREVYEWITAYAFLVVFTMCIVQEDNAVLRDEVVCKLQLRNSVAAVHKHQREVLTVLVDFIQLPTGGLIDDLHSFRIISLLILIVPLQICFK